MGAQAIEMALGKCNMKLSEIDLLISAGATFDYALPNQSSVVKSFLSDGMKTDLPAFDIDSSCLSFLSAFEIAASLLDGNRYKNIIVVSSEISSKGLDHNDWETLTLFGDGAVAAVLQFDPDSGSSFQKACLKTYSKGVEDCIIKGGGNRFSFKDHPYDPELHSFKMNGKKLLRLVKDKLPEFINCFFSDLHLSIEQSDVIIPHQASKLGVSMLSKMYDLSDAQVKGNLLTHGNCIAASIPLVLFECIESGSIRRGDTCFLIGTSAGVSIGGLLFTY
jgi:3-oxoacyl-[acyl-carrier-protein] synthase-3